MIKNILVVRNDRFGEFLLNIPAMRALKELYPQAKLTLAVNPAVCELPDEGVNFSGKWFKGKTDAECNVIPPAHKNARYTLSIPDLDNRDPALNDPNGVPIGGMV